MMASTCLAALAGLLVIGALIDIECRRLPNWLTGAVAVLYGVYVLVSPTTVDWISAFAVAGIVFAAGFACFAFRLMGGGDVKLLAGLALWAGTDHIGLFLVATSLAGGVLAIVMLKLRRWARSPLLAFLPLLASFAARTPLRPFATGMASAPAGPAENDAGLSLPYGVAIAAGGFFIIDALLQL